jgi:hypothetical protein
MVLTVLLALSTESSPQPSRTEPDARPMHH